LALSLAVIFGLALYIGVYFVATHSDGFEFIEERVRSSQAIRGQVGDIKEVRPSLLGSYDHKTVNADEWVSMTIDVIGSLKHIEIDVKAKKTNGAWKIESAQLGEQAVEVN
jgi:hypothetical protein